MLSISGATQEYFEKEFAESQERYLSQGATGAVDRRAFGKLAETFGLKGRLTLEQYRRLCRGKHPVTGEQLIRPQMQKAYLDAKGNLVKPAQHRPGWDVTFSPDKTFSLAVLVGDDKRLFDVYRRAVLETLEEAERFIQAKLGGDHGSLSTGNAIFVLFEHDSTRPTDGRVCPQLHTHSFLMNLTVDEKGKFHALETHEIYRVQHYLTTLLRAKLALETMKLGYELEFEPNGSWRIKGFSEAYIKDSSLRSERKKQELERLGLKENARNSEYAVLGTREKKSDFTQAEITRMWMEVEEKHGFQARNVVAEALKRGPVALEKHPELITEAVDFALERCSAREAVFDETSVLAGALKYEIGRLDIDQVKAEVAKRMTDGRLIHVSQRRETVQAAFTTPEMVRLERVILDFAARGRERSSPVASSEEIASATARYVSKIRETPGRENFDLNERQKEALHGVLTCRDRILGMQGKAGTGKTTVLEIVREVAEAKGYRVVGLAPTGRASQLLAKAGIETRTLQNFILSRKEPNLDGPVLYIVDESSIGSTRMVHRFLGKVNPDDRVVMVGDVRQHAAVEAGKPFELLQKKGMTTFTVDEIVRQKSPELREAVGLLSVGKVEAAFERLSTVTYTDANGTRKAIEEVRDRSERLRLIASEFAVKPGETLVVAPDNETRSELNSLIRSGLKRVGAVDGRESEATVFVGLNMDAATAKRSNAYKPGDIIRFSFSNKLFRAGEYVEVVSVEPRWTANRVTVRTETGTTVTYNPQRYTSSETYRRETRAFAVGDRVQFTRGDRERGYVNREMGVVTAIGEDAITVAAGEKGDKPVVLRKSEPLHLDHAYAVTSHSSQGETFGKVMVHADTTESAMLLNSTMAYVAASRAVHEVRIFTNDEAQLPKAMKRGYGKSSAIEAVENTKKGSLKSLSKARFPNQAVEAPSPSVEEAERNGKPRTPADGARLRKPFKVPDADRSRLGWLLGAEVKLKHLTDLRSRLVEQAEFRRYGVELNGHDRDAGHFDLYLKAKLRAKREARGLKGDERTDVLTRTVADETGRLAETNRQIDDKHAHQIAKLDARIAETSGRVETLRPVVAEVERRCAEANEPLPEPFIRRENLFRLHEYAVESSDPETIEQLAEVRKSQAREYGSPEWTDPERKRLAAQIRTAELRLATREAKHEEFLRDKHRWTYKVGGAEWSLSALDGRLAWNESNFGFQARKAEFYRNLLPRVRDPLKREIFNSKLGEAEAEIEKIRRETPELEAARTLVVGKIAVTDRELRLETEAEKRLLSALKGLETEPSAPEYRAHELVGMERTATDSANPGRLREYEREARRFTMRAEDAVERPDVLADLARRAEARCLVADIRVEKAREHFVRFVENRARVRIAYEAPDGSERTGTLREFEPKNRLERMKRVFAETFENAETTVNDIRDEHFRTPKILGFGLETVETGLAKLGAKGLQAARTTFGDDGNEAVSPSWTERLIRRLAMNLSEPTAVADRRKRIEAALDREETALRKDFERAQRFAETCREIADGYRQETGGTTIKPLFTTREAITVENRGIALGNEDLAKTGLTGAVEASANRRKFGSEHPLGRITNTDETNRHDVPRRIVEPIQPYRDVTPNRTNETSNIEREGR